MSSSGDALDAGHVVRVGPGAEADALVLQHDDRRRVRLGRQEDAAVHHHPVVAVLGLERAVERRDDTARDRGVARDPPGAVASGQRLWILGPRLHREVELAHVHRHQDDARVGAVRIGSDERAVERRRRGVTPHGGVSRFEFHASRGSCHSPSPVSFVFQIEGTACGGQATPSPPASDASSAAARRGLRLRLGQHVGGFPTATASLEDRAAEGVLCGEDVLLEPSDGGRAHPCARTVSTAQRTKRLGRRRTRSACIPEDACASSTRSPSSVAFDRLPCVVDEVDGQVAGSEGEPDRACGGDQGDLHALDAREATGLLEPRDVIGDAVGEAVVRSGGRCRSPPRSSHVTVCSCP